MKYKATLFALLAALASSASAVASITMDWVNVGNPGNAADTTGYGAVSHAYQIGSYEVTNAQYGAFLNAKGASNSGAIYNADMGSYGITQTGSSGSFSYSVTGGFENKPVVYVSWFDAARFANWMMNGQGSGDMETGAYTLNGATNGLITVNIGAQVYIPSENEWYKAAYYNAATTSYSIYPNNRNSIGQAEANYDTDGSIDVGSLTSDPSSYGTFEQGGNVYEWNDTVISYRSKGLRGGSWNGAAETALASATRLSVRPSTDSNFLGFRVASIPEPTSMLLVMLAGGMLLIRRRPLTSDL